MFYAKDADDLFVLDELGQILITDDWTTMFARLRELGFGHTTTTHEFELRDLLIMRDRVTHLRLYLSLDKFKGPGNDYVNVADVFHRLDN